METNTSMGNDTEATSNKKDIVVPEAIKKSGRRPLGTVENRNTMGDPKINKSFQHVIFTIQIDCNYTRKVAHENLKPCLLMKLRLLSFMYVYYIIYCYIANYPQT